MERIRELIAGVRELYPSDGFFVDFESSCADRPLKRAFYERYDHSLRRLDREAWLALKRKAARHFLVHRQGQWKQGFFNILNESFAYGYLIDRGFTEVVFENEEKDSNAKSADLSFKRGGLTGLCEVKSIGISDDEIGRRVPGQCIDGSVHEKLSPAFFGKLLSDIDKAKLQIATQPETSIVFVVIEFDDFTHDYLSNYVGQLRSFITGYPPSSLVLRFGHDGTILVS